jgi:asparagine synthase (glutamine-hydrolysing)
MRGIVPDTILDRRDKIGFTTPEQRWCMELAPLYRGWLMATAKDVPFLDASRVIETFDAMVAGRVKFSWQVWRWVNYARWWNGVFPSGTSVASKHEVADAI